MRLEVFSPLQDSACRKEQQSDCSPGLCAPPEGVTSQDAALHKTVFHFLSSPGAGVPSYGLFFSSEGYDSLLCARSLKLLCAHIGTVVSSLLLPVCHSWVSDYPAQFLIHKVDPDSSSMKLSLSTNELYN